MELKYTPGPWLVSKLSGSTPSPYRITTNVAGAHNQLPIAHIFESAFNPEYDTEANAKLIAASPELLEVLDEVVSDLFYQIEAKHGPKVAHDYPCLVKAKAIIKKATE